MGNNMHKVLPTAMSLASLSSLGLLRDRMMKRRPKEEEAWTEQDVKRHQQLKKVEEHQKRSKRNALSTAAGLGAFAVVGTTHLPSLHPDGDFEAMKRPSTASSLTSGGSPQRILAEVKWASQIGFDSGIANAATTSEEYGRGSHTTLYSAEAGASTSFAPPIYETNQREESSTQPLNAVANDRYGAAARYPDQHYKPRPPNRLLSASSIDGTLVKRPSFAVWNKKLLDEQNRERLENTGTNTFSSPAASSIGSKIELSTPTDLAKRPSFTVWNKQLLDKQLDDLPVDSAVASSSTFVASADKNNAESATRMEAPIARNPRGTQNGVMSESSAATSSTSTIASEFSRGTYGIYDSQVYTKESPSNVYSGGFSPPLKELTPRKSRSFMLGGVSLRDLKSRFDARDQKRDPDPILQKDNQAPREAASPFKGLTRGELGPSVAPTISSFPSKREDVDETSVQARTQSSTDRMSTPKTSPATEPKASPELSVVPENIQLTRDDLLPMESSAETKTVIPDRIQLSTDVDASPQTLLPPQQNVYPEIPSSPPPLSESVVKNMYTRGTSFEITDENKESSGDLSKASRQNTFYGGIGAGTFAAAVAKAFDDDTKKTRREISSSTSAETDGLLPRPTTVARDNINSDQPFAFRAKSQTNQESRFEMKTPITYASSESEQMKTGQERLSVAVDSTLEVRSSLRFATNNGSAGDPAYNELYLIDTKAVEVSSVQETDGKTSYLDSLRRASPTLPTSRIGMRSYLDELSNASPFFRTPPIEAHGDDVGSSLDSCVSSLDNISQDLEHLSKDLKFITPDISSDLDSISSDLDSVTQDISSASAALLACGSQREESKNCLSSVTHFESYLDSLSQDDTSSVCSGQGLSSYLNDLASASALSFDLPEQRRTNDVETSPSLSFGEYYDLDTTPKLGSYLDSISKGDSTVLCGKGLTSYVSELSSAPPLAFDLPGQESSNSPVVPVVNSVMSSYTKPILDFTTMENTRPRKVRVFVEHSVNIQKRLGGTAFHDTIDATSHSSYNYGPRLLRDGTLSAMQSHRRIVSPGEPSSDSSDLSAPTSSYSAEYSAPSNNGATRRFTVAVDHFVERSYEY